MNWKKLNEEKPICYIKDEGDGLRSEILLLMDKNGLFITGYCYQGIMDGSEFCDFFSVNDFELKDITHFCEIKNP